MTAEPVEPEGMAAELAGALADRDLVLVSAAYLEARADEESVPFRLEDDE